MIRKLAAMSLRANQRIMMEKYAGETGIFA